MNGKQASTSLQLGVKNCIKWETELNQTSMSGNAGMCTEQFGYL